MGFVFIWEQTATCATYSINWLVFITEMKSVYSAVRTGSLNKAVCASSAKVYNTIQKKLIRHLVLPMLFLRMCHYNNVLFTSWSFKWSFSTIFFSQIFCNFRGQAVPLKRPVKCDLSFVILKILSDSYEHWALIVYDIPPECTIVWY